MNQQEFTSRPTRQGGFAGGWYRFRFLFYTGGAVSVLLTAALGIVSYTALEPTRAGFIKFVVAGGTALVLAIVAFLVYVVLKELNSRFRAYQREHELNQLKSNFITLASHEFRTPLSSILLSVALIEKYAARQETEKITKHSWKIRQVVHNLESILEDFLSLEKLDAGNLKANMAPFDLPELCREVLAAASLAAKAGQQLTYESEDSGTMVLLDRHLIRKAIEHLLRNAINYAGGDARIGLFTTINANEVRISVIDNGQGIAAKDQEKLFSLFFRVDGSGNIPGTGLGLAIVQRYVELMNGRLRFYSKPYQETCFEMEFPA